MIGAAGLGIALAALIAAGSFWITDEIRSARNMIIAEIRKGREPKCPPA